MNKNTETTTTTKFDSRTKAAASRGSRGLNLMMPTHGCGTSGHSPACGTSPLRRCPGLAK